MNLPPPFLTTTRPARNRAIACEIPVVHVSRAGGKIFVVMYFELSLFRNIATSDKPGLMHTRFMQNCKCVPRHRSRHLAFPRTGTAAERDFRISSR